MSRSELIGAFVAIAIVFALGWWLHRVGKVKDADARIEAIAIWAGWSGVLIIGTARMAGVA